MSESPTIEAARLITAADALIVAAGAGMGVDSGLPAFRGDNGFPAAFSSLAQRGLRYEDLANPAMFDRDPHLAWGFFGRCIRQYHSARPHAGFAAILRWASECTFGAFVYTRKIDGHFQAAGFDPAKILECHGSSLWLQCTAPCSTAVWPFQSESVQIDECSMMAADPLPRCPTCNTVARPNVRLFEDAQWVGEKTRLQSAAYERWKAEVAGQSVVVIECGAGLVVPAVRLTTDWALLQLQARLIRINPVDCDVPPGHISVKMGACKALREIDQAVGNMR